MKALKSILPVVVLVLSVLPVQAQKTWYVSQSSGSNRNEGTREAPLKNIQKAIDLAAPGDVIRVAEGNYFGLLDSGNIKINKGISIFGGYAPDFSQRDILRYRTFVQPTATSNGSSQGQPRFFSVISRFSSPRGSP